MPQLLQIHSTGSVNKTLFWGKNLVKRYIRNHVPTWEMSPEINEMFVVALEFCLTN